MPRFVKMWGFVFPLFLLYLSTTVRFNNWISSEDCKSFSDSDLTVQTTICSWQKPRAFLCHQITSDLLLSHHQVSLFMLQTSVLCSIAHTWWNPSVAHRGTGFCPSPLSQLLCRQFSVITVVFVLVYWFVLQFLLHILLWIFRRPL
jgi:hypothetical protein